MNMTLDVPDKIIADTLCAAFEGGIGYWAFIESQADPKTLAKPWGEDYTPSYISYPLSPGGAIQLYVQDDSPEHPTKCRPLCLETIQAGLVVMATKYPRHFGDMLSENGDTTTGDVFVQCCVLGDLVFG